MLIVECVNLKTVLKWCLIEESFTYLILLGHCLAPDSVRKIVYKMRSRKIEEHYSLPVSPLLAKSSCSTWPCWGQCMHHTQQQHILHMDETKAPEVEEKSKEEGLDACKSSDR